MPFRAKSSTAAKRTGLRRKHSEIFQNSTFEVIDLSDNSVIAQVYFYLSNILINTNILINIGLFKRFKSWTAFFNLKEYFSANTRL